MGQSTATTAAFNPMPHLIGIGLLGAANPLIYVNGFSPSFWISPILGVALLVGLIYGGYRLLAPARAKASGLKPFILLAWVLVALVTLQAWTEKPAVGSAPSSPVIQLVTAPSSPNNHGLQPFNGKLDQEVQLVPFNGKLD